MDLDVAHWPGELAAPTHQYRSMIQSTVQDKSLAALLVDEIKLLLGLDLEHAIKHVCREQNVVSHAHERT